MPNIATYFELFDPETDHDPKVEAIVEFIESHPLCALEKSPNNELPPLHHAIKELASPGFNDHDITNIVKALLKHNPEIEFKDTHGRTPLWIAASKGEEEVVRILLQSGASPLVECFTCKLSVLHIAAQKRHIEVVQLLLEKEIPVDPQDSKGETPLFKAVRNNDLEMVKVLIEHGASKSIQNKAGESPESLVTTESGILYVDPKVETEITGKISTRPNIYEEEEEEEEEAEADGEGNDYDYENDPFLHKFLDHIEERKLEKFFTRDGAKLKDALRPSVKQAKILIEALRAENEESASEVALLTLYDLAILIDDSTSMRWEEQGTRIQVLQDFLKAISYISSFAKNEKNGTIRRIRFLNSRKGGDHIDRASVEKLLYKHPYTGMTRIGSQLKKKILSDLVSPKMPRPLLVMVITDGDVQGERKNVLYDVLTEVYQFCQDFPTGEYSVSFKFCRIGDDQGAKDMLEDLDNHEQLGKHIDCQRAHVNLASIINRTNSFEFQDLTKLLIGAISSEWDDVEDSSDSNPSSPIEKPSILNSPL